MKNKIAILILILSFNFVCAQKTTLINNSTILVNSKDSLLAYYSTTKDTSRVSISIYINGFESKKKREKVIAEYKNKRNSDSKLPTFSANFISVTKPEKLNSLDGVNYISTKQFNPYIQIQNPTYFIVKQNDGTYLKWKTILYAEE